MQRGLEARAEAVAAGDWLPVAALQETISEAAAQCAARDVYAALRRRWGVRSPEEAEKHLTYRVFIATLFTIPEAEAINTPWVQLRLPPKSVAPPAIQRPPPGQRGSGALAKALQQTEAAGE
jgi:hypothetical protein